MLSIPLSLLTLSASAFASPLEARASCSGPRILWARGTNEDYSNSTLIPLVNYLQSSLAGSSSAIIYPATVAPSNQDSLNQGINNTILQIKQWQQQCGASTKIVLVGYSQGGQVMTDTLVGGAFQDPPIDPSYWKYITASVVFGDPTFTYPGGYCAGNATSSGVYQRADSTQQTLNTNFSQSLRSYCTAGDPICSGLQNTNAGAHLAEVRDHTTEAETFVLSRFGK